MKKEKTDIQPPYQSDPVLPLYLRYSFLMLSLFWILTGYEASFTGYLLRIGWILCVHLPNIYRAVAGFLLRIFTEYPEQLFPDH